MAEAQPPRSLTHLRYPFFPLTLEGVLQYPEQSRFIHSLRRFHFVSRLFFFWRGGLCVCVEGPMVALYCLNLLVKVGF